MNTEHRALTAEVRVPDDGTRTFEAVVMRYGTVDDYDTIFDKGCFAASLEQRMPRITWAHNWSEPLGRYVDYKDTRSQLTLVGEFDDFDDVPRARQAWAQLRSGTIDQFSVGFHRIQTRDDDENRTHFTEAGLDEVALVLVGAVPGTKLVNVRSAATGLQVVRQVPEDLVISLGKKIAAGDMTYDEAMAAVNLTAGIAPAPTDPNEPVSTDVPPGLVATVEEQAAADAIADNFLGP